MHGEVPGVRDNLGGGNTSSGLEGVWWLLYHVPKNCMLLYGGPKH